MDNPETLLHEVLEAGLAAVRPEDVLPTYFPEPPAGKLVVIGAGKASAAMAQTCEQYYQVHHPDMSLSGVVITRYGHAVPTNIIEVIEAAHPVPDEAGVQGTQKLLDELSDLHEDDLVLCLISGGGSALLTSPLELSLTEHAAVTQALLHSGADIREMNVVRKHLSKVKGGRLAEAAFPARVVSLLISDVPGDDPSSIASGPTVPDSSTFADALEIFERYELNQPAAKRVLTKGVSGELPDTPDSHAPCFANTETRIIATAQGMLEAAANTLNQHGITPLILTDCLTGEAKEAAKFHAALARQVREHSQPLTRPCALLSGGETSVTIRQSDTSTTGRGGRNCEFLLSLAIELAGLPNTYALAADSDGIDGIGDAAGAIISPDSLPFGLREARDYLTRHDAYTYFERLGTLIKTGPTHTNVNDLRVVLVL
jgi:hydroxypyruvate reductase